MIFAVLNTPARAVYVSHGPVDTGFQPQLYESDLVPRQIKPGMSQQATCFKQSFKCIIVVHQLSALLFCVRMGKSLGLSWK